MIGMRDETGMGDGFEFLSHKKKNEGFKALAEALEAKANRIKNK